MTATYLPLQIRIASKDQWLVWQGLHHVEKKNDHIAANLA
ncbi:hypothetical protein SynRS9915_01316 [Synechococcus sp. RS9915]|nr:hypothetical protein SynRS9915_01316 [Synechococcus sp. RS9915]